MNPQSLHALVIDRHFGELAPEAADLLEHHLAQNPAARTEAERILQSLAVTGDAMLRHPELAQVAPVAKASTARSWQPALSVWMLRAAALLLLATVAAAAGFITGRSTAPVTANPVLLAAVSQPSEVSSKSGPWARYRMSFDPSGSGVQVVRVDVPTPESKTLR